MLRALLILLLALPSLVRAGSVLDATGRTVEIPAQVARVLPAGPPAAVLLLAVAPDLMIGFLSPVSGAARSMLTDAAARLPQVPRLTGKDDSTDAVRALKPDLILDYGTISPRFTELATATQQRTGIPTVLLDGSLADTPSVLRLLGTMLHREGRAETLARLAEALLAVPAGTGKAPTIVYARGADGSNVVAPDTGSTEVFNCIGWPVLAPEGQGWFRAASIDDIARLDPDVLIFGDPAMHNVLAHSDVWRRVRAVRDGHAFIAPSLPFGWIEEPPSVNRLLGLAWLQGRDLATLATLFNAAFYDRTLKQHEIDTMLSGISIIHPR